MIISLYPLFEGEVNIFQFEPYSPSLLEILTKAKAVIFPPTITPELYFFVKNQGIPVFPEYTLRFLYPGKIGQILLFKSLNLPHPQTIIVPRLCGIEENPYERSLSLNYPFVIKGNWGDEGREVFLVEGEEDWREALKIIKSWERSGRFGFLIQEYLPTPFDARSIVIGDKIWVVFREGGFKKNLVQGGKIIPPPNPFLEDKVIKVTQALIKNTYFNLVAIDFLFKKEEPLLNELNFVFGRRTLGEEAFTKSVKEAIENFLRKIIL